MSVEVHKSRGLKSKEGYNHLDMLLVILLIQGVLLFGALYWLTTPKPKASVTNPSGSELITARATAQAPLNQEVIFSPEGAFTTEVLERVRHNVFLTYVQDNENLAVGSAWLYKVEGNTSYFVTAAHVLTTLPGEQLYLSFMRPHLDTEFFIPRHTEYEVDAASDVAIIRAEGVPPLSADYPPFPLSHNIPYGQPALIAGFPGVIWGTEGNPFTARLFSDVGAITMAYSYIFEDSQLEFTGYLIDAPVSAGMSGGLVLVMNEAGQPEATGIISATKGRLAVVANNLWLEMLLN